MNRTVCRAAAFLALPLLLTLPALAEETPGSRAVREAREAMAIERGEAQSGFMLYSRYFDPNTMIGFPVHGFRQDNPAAAYREAGSLDAALNDTTVWKFQVEGTEIFTMQRTDDSFWETVGHAVGTNVFIEPDAVAAAIDGDAALWKAPWISLKFAASSYCQTYFALVLTDGGEWVVPFGSRPDRTGLENGRLYTAEEAVRTLEAYDPAAESVTKTVITPGRSSSPLPIIAMAAGAVILLGAAALLLTKGRRRRLKHG